ncbi:uncharacterized protein LOC118195687 [Stegodyphus dumicola]|uniref:uncharacterized protein LOC118195687 n=1 Tax=Stegodyphus dumicola TaxID=202533 RepID=UPI0015A7FA68|nr:uncharacterized protein LOC118195687 [Stegodyphus dumicola]XP_035222907.1 uncharacterized protein LOC118195687 [Stegodyphus dumicola]XP_035222908.1 uncharacterized protein LOC118195687 [Stegodyphus dumicola]
MLLRFMALVTAVVRMVSAQDRGGTILQQGETTDPQSVIVTARTRAFLSCESGDIVVKVNFTQPFRGLMYAHRSRTSPCRIHGTGDYYYELRIPLKGCGTWQESPRVFVNNITIRFHPALELEEDETKTVVCRYPPPLTPPPGSIQIVRPPTVVPSVVPTRIGTAKLSEVEILIIICLLLFLSLLTLGIGIAYFCLKRRNIRIIRKSTLTSSSAPPSQITRLSSSNLQPPSSLLSSVLGHTVRIPRAVPYSAPAGRASALSSPDQPYEEYPASTSTTETTSGELSEASASSSSLAEDQVDGSKHLLYRKGGPKSILSIPKAILRKTGNRRWVTEPTVHHYYSKAKSTATTSVKRPETEDQTVTTVLEPENQNGDVYFAARSEESKFNARNSVRQNLQTRGASVNKLSSPLYAQVDKNRKTGTKGQEVISEERRSLRWPAKPSAIPGAARRQRQIVTEVPEESETSEEVTKNTTVTTSVRREITETEVLSPLSRKLQKGNEISEGKDGSLKSSDVTESASDLQKTDTSAGEDNVLQKPPKSILIRDVADIYLTTTVETESRELKTRVSRDIVEEHKKIEGKSSEIRPSLLNAKDKTKTQSRVPPTTENWNVVIRQRKPVEQDHPIGTNLDGSAESSAEEGDSQEPPSTPKPHFDVKIRTIPPDELKPKKSEDMISIPPLEMPQTVDRLKEALRPKSQEEPVPIPLSSDHLQKDVSQSALEDKDKSSQPQRTVRWMDDTKDSTPDEGSTVSSSDSFHSAESLRERSSSEVLEVIPTLPSQRRNSDHPMLERSTSEIVTSPDDHVRWVGGVVPVLESLSPEFLANIPVVIQGGFFNKQKSSTAEGEKSPL